MNEIGALLKATREANGVSLKEASEDLDIKDLILDNIEDGNIGAFKDIFTLQKYLFEYSKYLGLDLDKVEHQFNNYMFEYTSKISKKKLEKAIVQKNKLEKKENKVVSPYTKSKEENKTLRLYIIYSLLVIAFVFLVVLIIKLIFFS